MQKNPTCFVNQERTFATLHCSEQRLEVSDVGRTLHPTAWCSGVLTREIIMGDILPNLRFCVLTTTTKKSAYFCVLFWLFQPE